MEGATGKFCCCGRGWGETTEGPQMSNGERKKIGGTGGCSSIVFWGSLKFFFGLGGLKDCDLVIFWGKKLGEPLGRDL